MSKTTVAVIGGGVSGLSAACYLSRKGMRVKVLEANDKVGGCCANTTLNGYTFHDGAIYLAVPAILDHAFRQLGLDRPSLLPIRKIASHKTTLPDGSMVYVGDRSVRVVRHGRGTHTLSGAEVEPFLGRWEPVLRLFADDIMLHPFSLPHFIAKGWRHIHKFQGSVASQLKRIFKDEAVRSAMSGALLYTGAPPERTPAPSLLGLAALLAEGFYLPEGGMGRVPEILRRSLESNGGEISLGAKAKRIVIKGGKVAGLEVEGQGVVEADAVISTVSGMATFAALLNNKDVPDAMRRKVKHSPLSRRGMIVQLGLSNVIDVQSHSNSVLPMMREQYKALAPEDRGMSWPVYSVPTVTCPELAPRGGSIVEIFPPVQQHIHVDYWDEEKKEKVAAMAIEKLSAMHKIDVAVQRTVSPKDFRDRLHLYQGALYGLSPLAEPRAQFRHVSPIPGLFLAGQTTFPGFGVGPAAMSGIFAAEALLNSSAARPH